MKNYLGIFIFLISVNSYCWEPISGKIKGISVYPSRDIILVSLEEPGEVNPDCTDTNSFAIASSVPENRRNAMLSILLMARASSRNVSIAYYKSGSCATYGEGSTFRSIQRLNL